MKTVLNAFLFYFLSSLLHAKLMNWILLLFENLWMIILSLNCLLPSTLLWTFLTASAKWSPVLLANLEIGLPRWSHANESFSTNLCSKILSNRAMEHLILQLNCLSLPGIHLLGSQVSARNTYFWSAQSAYLLTPYYSA